VAIDEMSATRTSIHILLTLQTIAVSCII